MHTYVPYARIFLHDVHSIGVAANGHIQILDSSTGSVLHSTTEDGKIAEKIHKSGEIVAAGVDENFTLLVTATSNKTIRVWSVPELCIISERDSPKKPTDICFTHDAKTILVSDKFGDVHRYPLRDSQASNRQEEASLPGGSDIKGAKKRLSDETLLLGHVSLLTTLLLSKDDKYIITADRDEHIRVSWYPESYTIESYCLGHRKFVSSLHIPDWDPSLLISGGGDPVLKIWSWREGKLLYDIPISDAVMPFVKVVRKKPGRGEEGSDGEEEGAPRISSRARRRNKKKQKGKERSEREEALDGEPENKPGDKDNEMQLDERYSVEAEISPVHDNDESERTNAEQLSGVPPLLAIQKILTLEFRSTKTIVFSAHGATALFYYRFPEPSDLSPEVRSISIGWPVLDFDRWLNSDEIWVAVDGNWSEVATAATFIRIIKFVRDQLVLAEVDDSAHRLLASSLNTTSRIQSISPRVSADGSKSDSNFAASEESLKKIDLYAPLVVLPKNLDVEHNAMDSEVQPSDVNTKQLSGKELGRLQTKKAVLALQAAERRKGEPGDTPDETRTLKRQKGELSGNVE